MKYISYLLIFILIIYSIILNNNLYNLKKKNNIKPKFKENFVTIIHTISIDYQKSQLSQPKKDLSIKKVPKKQKLISVQEKKDIFKKLLVKNVMDVYNELDKFYLDIKYKIENNTSKKEIELLKKDYLAIDNEDLLKRLKPHPVSITLAQAAMESSWATSRFFKKANNIFGIWSFKTTEPRIQASKTREGKEIWIRKYRTIKDSIKDYYSVIARGFAFKSFRTLRMQTSDPYELVKKLHKYSEKGHLYSNELSDIIKFNKFDIYDINNSKLNK